MVTMENYEVYMMLQADGELDEAGCEALQAFLHRHPELEDEMKLFDSLHLEPDTTMVYTGKEQLLKPVPAKRTIALGWRSYAAAAGVAAVIGLAMWLYQRPGTETTGTTEVATTVIPKNNTTKTSTNPVAATTADTQKQAMPQQGLSNIAAVKKSPLKPGNHENTPVPQTQQEQLAALQPLPAQPVDAPQIVAPVTETLPAVQFAAVKEEKQNKRFLAWLPLPDEKKQGLIMVKNAFDERVEQVRELNNNIKETALVFNIGSKGITLNF